MRDKKLLAVIYALLAAVFYSLNAPFSKLLLNKVSTTFMAGLLYLGAGAGVATMYFFQSKKEDKSKRLTKKDMPYTVGMIILDVLAPIFLMIGINSGTAANASLLGNFEIVATTLIALSIFKESVSPKLWTAIGFITVASIILSFDGSDSVKFSTGSLFVLLATVCWGLENNCTRSISQMSTYQIVILKGLCCGAVSCTIAFLSGERLPDIQYIGFTMLLGFVAYGLSIFTYIRAQRELGAAKTSSYYAVAPFLGAFLGFLINGERITWTYLIALVLMVIGTMFVIFDTVTNHHKNTHNQKKLTD